MEWRTQGLCHKCGERLPHDGCVHISDQMRYRKCPPDDWDRPYTFTVVIRSLGGSSTDYLQSNNIERLKLDYGYCGNQNQGTTKMSCFRFSELLRHSPDHQTHMSLRGLNPFWHTTRQRLFRRLDDMERLCFLDSSKFRCFWHSLEKGETSWKP